MKSYPLILMALLFSLAVLPPLGHMEAASSVGSPLIAAQTNDAPEGATRADESPMDEFDPTEATWKAWVGPIVIGIFGIVLILLIRRFSRRGGKRDPE